jgi:hypothetical protein
MFEGYHHRVWHRCRPSALVHGAADGPTLARDGPLRLG